MEKKGLDKGKGFKISTGGSSLIVRVGTSNNKSQRKPITCISLETIMKCQVVLELSSNGTKKLCSVLRKGSGKKEVLETIIFGQLDDFKRKLTYIMTLFPLCSKIRMAMSLRDLIIVKNTSDFVIEFQIQELLVLLYQQ